MILLNVLTFSGAFATESMAQEAISPPKSCVEKYFEISQKKQKRSKTIAVVADVTAASLIVVGAAAASRIEEGTDRETIELAAAQMLTGTGIIVLGQIISRLGIVGKERKVLRIYNSAALAKEYEKRTADEDPQVLPETSRGSRRIEKWANRIAKTDSNVTEIMVADYVLSHFLDGTYCGETYRKRTHGLANTKDIKKDVYQHFGMKK